MRNVPRSLLVVLCAAGFLAIPPAVLAAGGSPEAGAGSPAPVANSSPAPASSGSPAPSVGGGAWLQVQLGDSVPEVRARFGDPVSMHAVSGSIEAAVYKIPTVNAFMTLYESGGRVQQLRVIGGRENQDSGVTDPFGVSLGEAQEKLTAARGTPRRRLTMYEHDTVAYFNASDSVSFYELDDSKVLAIELATAQENLEKLPAVRVRPEHDGSSIDQAIIVMQPTDQSTVDWEYLYLAMNPCSGDTRWKMQRQTLQHQGPRSYDVLEVVCPPTGAKRTFVFDITPGFGKS